MIFFGGVTGIWLGGWLADRLGGLNRAAYAWVPAGAFLLCVPLYALGALAPPSDWSLLIFLMPIALALAWLGPTICAIQHLVPLPPPRREPGAPYGPRHPPDDGPYAVGSFAVDGDALHFVYGLLRLR